MLTLYRLLHMFNTLLLYTAYTILLLLSQTNTFQCVVASDGYESFAIFLYAHGGIQWTTADSFLGKDGLGGFPALAGINSGDGVNFNAVPESKMPEIINIDETSNVGIPGIWMFQVGESM